MQIIIDNPYKKTGFSLAEALITTTIIGIIACLTIPNVINSIQKVDRIRFKENYSVLSAVSKLIMSDNGGDMVNIFANDTQLRDKFKNYLNYIRECNMSSSNCWYTTNTMYLNGTSSYAYNNVTSLVLNNGALLFFDRDYTSCSGGCGATETDCLRYCGWIDIDVNGHRGPNTWGVDLFTIWIKEYGLEPAGYKVIKDPRDSADYKGCDINVSSLAGRGQGCAYKVLKNEDYSTTK